MWNRKKQPKRPSKRQCLYLMVNVPFLIFWKIGISNSTRAHRSVQVSKAAPGKAVVFWVWDIPNAKAVEGFLHTICAPFNVRYYRGDGNTEWFFFPAAIVTIAFMLLWHIVLYAIIVTCVVAFGYILRTM
jgi:hypothetical protein